VFTKVKRKGKDESVKSCRLEKINTLNTSEAFPSVTELHQDQPSEDLWPSASLHIIFKVDSLWHNTGPPAGFSGNEAFRRSTEFRERFESSRISIYYKKYNKSVYKYDDADYFLVLNL